MPTRIDHVIAGAADFVRLEETFAHLGFHITGGGVHPHLGTRNRIIILGEGYFELLGIADQARVSSVIARRLAQNGSGWVGFALQSGDIDREASEMRERGVDARGPRPGQLVAPNGIARGWRTVTVDSDDLWAAAEPIPFLIQHDTSGPQHQRELAGESSLAPHPNGAQRLAAVTIATPDLLAARQTFALVYSLTTSQSPYTDTRLNAQMLDLSLAASGEIIRLAQPLGPGLAEQRLTHAGPSVCEISMVVANLDEAKRYFDQQHVAYDFDQSSQHLTVSSQESLNIPLSFIA